MTKKREKKPKLTLKRAKLRTLENSEMEKADGGNAALTDGCVGSYIRCITIPRPPNADG
jgi:hypothetical protein